MDQPGILYQDTHLEHLYEDEFVCLGWSGNTQLHRALSLDTYLKLGHVVVRFGKHRELPTFDDWLTQHLGHDRRIEVVTTAFNLVPQSLIGTSRIATVHGRLAAFYQRFLPLRIVAPPLKIPKFEQFMQWHRSRDRDPGSVWLRSVLKSAIAESTLNKEAAPLTSARRDEPFHNGIAHLEFTRRLLLSYPIILSQKRLDVVIPAQSGDARSIPRLLLAGLIAQAIQNGGDDPIRTDLCEFTY